MLEFQEDENKARKNIRNHGISFDETKSVFFDLNASMFIDNEHSSLEERYILIGYSKSNKLFVSYTERKDKIRLFQLGRQHQTKEIIMKKRTKIIDGDLVAIINENNENLNDNLANEYDSEKVELKPNPYAERLRKQNLLTVQLDSDVSEYFRNAREVNNYLRNQIELIKNIVKA